MRKRRVGRQRGGIAPLLALAVPALLAAGKAATLGGISAAANNGTHKALDSLSKLKRTYKKRHTRTARY